MRQKRDNDALARWRNRKISMLQDSLEFADNSVSSRLLNVASTSVEQVEPVCREVRVSQEFLLNERL